MKTETPHSLDSGRTREQLLDAFAQAWRRGEPPSLADFVPADPSERAALLAELVRIDMEFRARAGMSLSLDDYLARYPELHDQPALMQKLAATCSAILPSTAEPGATLDHVAELTMTPAESLPTIPGYELLAELGRGGMGVVYKARQIKLNRLVALKMILAGAHASKKSLERFHTEAEAVARLRHPNIVQIYEIGEQDGLPYFSLEFIEGGTLADRIKGTPQPAESAARLVETLARAIHAAHDSGILHRDLKPANVLLHADGTPKITDFGLAKKLDEAGQTATGDILGTPSYMAPEQASGRLHDVGPAVDVYALGAILYELLTGRPPFRAARPLDTLLQVVSDEVVPPRRLQSKTPRDLDTICLKCLHKEPHKRYRSASELADDLARFREGRPIHARPVGRIERIAKGIKRRPLMSAGIALGVVLTIAGVAWYQAEQVRRVTEETQRAAERDRSRALDELAIQNGIQQARKARAELQQTLKASRGVFALLNEPLRWQAQIELARASLAPAQTVWDQADEPLDPALGVALRDLASQLQNDDADRRLALRLEKIRTDIASMEGGKLRYAAAAEEYPRTFQDGGYAVLSDDIGRLGKQIAASPIRAVLIAALDDWAAVALSLKKDAVMERVLEVARAADTECAWCNGLRQPAVWRDPQAVVAWTKDAPVATLSPQTLVLSARLLKQGSAEEETWLRKARVQYPADFWLNFELAYALRTREPAEALGYLRVAHAARQDNLAVAINLSEQLIRMKRPLEAIDICEKATRAHPADQRMVIHLAKAFNALGDQQMEEKRHADAIRSYRQALEKGLKTLQVYYNLGRALVREKRLDEALPAFDEARKLAPKFASAHWNYGGVLFQLERFDEAAKAFQQAVELEPNNAATRFNLGLTLGRLDRLEEARDTLEATIKLDPKHPLAHGALATTYFRLGEFEKAHQSMQRALSLLPTMHPSRPLMESQLEDIRRALKKRSGSL